MPTRKVSVFKHECTRCSYTWVSRVNGKPKYCPNCKSPNWDIIKEEKKK